MKKIAAFIFLILLTNTSSLFAAGDQGSPGAFSRFGTVWGRGFLGLTTFWLEIPYTFVREPKKHRFAWPVTAIPRSVFNMAYRVTSAANDIIFYPIIVPFSEETGSLNHAMGLSEYAWQPEEDAF